MLLPGGRLVGGGKQGRYYVLDAQHMTLAQDAASPDPTLIGEGFQAFRNTWRPLSIASYASNETNGPNIHGCPIYWEGTSYIYQMPEKDYLKAFSYDRQAGTVMQTPARTATVRPPDGMPGAFSSISANGNTDGIVWTIIISNGNGQWMKVPAIFVAFDATTLQEIWRDPVNEVFSKFCPPTIADGKVVRPTSASNVEAGRNTGKVIVYGLL
jgi:outer membrane protein assembly factor BamB